MNIHSSRFAMPGNLNKICETECEVEVHWEIENFQSYLQSNCSFESQPFKFKWSDFNWRLSLKYVSMVNSVQFYLHNSMHENENEASVIFKYGILLVNGSAEMRGCLTKTFKPPDTGFGTQEFILKSELEARKHEILKDETLTVYCTIHQANLKNPERSKYESLDTLSSSLKALYGCTKRSDLTIIVGEKRYPVHKMILEMRSDVFAAMFRHDMDESNSGIINISDCDPTSFNDFLLYLYTGKVENISSNNVQHLFVIADKYNVQDLKSVCIQFMKNTMSTANMFEIVIMAHQFNETELKSVTLSFFKRNALEIIKGDKWEQFLKQNFSLANELLIYGFENITI